MRELLGTGHVLSLIWELVMCVSSLCENLRRCTLRTFAFLWIDVYFNKKLT